MLALKLLKLRTTGGDAPGRRDTPDQFPADSSINRIYATEIQFRHG
jgi:hypothetical protein